MGSHISIRTQSAMLVPLICLSLLCLAVSAHEYYSGRCPQFVPMASLDWQRFTGDWWAVFKMSSRSSCIRYNFATSGGERIVTEEKLLPVLGRFGVPSTVHSEGRLSVTDPGQEATMIVHWDTGVLGDGLMFSDKDYVVLDTDYTSRALVCSCQHLNLGFFAVNRRSCDYMIRPSDGAVFPTTLPADYSNLLDSTPPDLALDMKRVRQDKCDRLETDPALDLGKVWSYGQTLAGLAANMI